MLVGIDVTHPGLTAVKGTPSIAAVVGSIDADYAQFPASLRMQEPRKEVCDLLLKCLKFLRLGRWCQPLRP